MVTYIDFAVAGTSYSELLSAKVRKSIGNFNTASTFTAKLKNTDGRFSNTFDINQEVVIKADKDTNPATTKILTGVIDSIEYIGKGSNDEKLIISGRDYSARLQDVTVEPNVWNNTEIATIVSEIMAAEVPDITTNNVQTTNISIDIEFNHKPVFDALKQLAQRADFIFYVDEDKDLHFEPKGETDSGITFDSTNVEHATTKKNETELVNKIWVYGDRQLTGWRNTFTANGGSEYTLDYKPHNTEVFVAGSTQPKNGAVANFVVGDVGSPTQYLVNFNDKKIIFVSGTSAGDNIPVSGTDSINVEYQRSTPIVRVGQDDVSVNTYGEKEKFIIDKDIKTFSAAEDLVITELSEKSSPTISLALDIQGIVAITPGNTATVNLPNHNINNNVYDILEASFEFNKENMLADRVARVKLNRRVIDLSDTLKQMKLDIKKLQADDVSSADVITRMVLGIGSIGLEVSEWSVGTRSLEHGFTLGHNVNGVLGSPQIGVNGSQLVLGSATRGAFTVQQSGGTFN